MPEQPTSGDQVRVETAEKYRARAESLLRLAQHLATQIVGGRCDLTAFPEDRDRKEAWRENQGRCPGDVVAIRWEDGFADKVCERHAAEAESRGVIVVRPQRHDGTQTVTQQPETSRA